LTWAKSLSEAIEFAYQALKVKPAELECWAGFWGAAGGWQGRGMVEGAGLSIPATSRFDPRALSRF